MTIDTGENARSYTDQKQLARALEAMQILHDPEEKVFLDDPFRRHIFI